MKKLLIICILFAVLAAAHQIVLSAVDTIALRFSVPYVEPPNDRKPEGYADGDLYGQLQAESANRIYDLQRLRHYLEFKEENVKPLEKKIEGTTNVIFALLYFFLFSYAAYVICFSIKNGAMIRMASAIAGFSKKAGVSGVFKRTRLSALNNEYLKYKEMFDNGLISEKQLSDKKLTIQAKIKNSDLID